MPPLNERWFFCSFCVDRMRQAPEKTLNIWQIALLSGVRPGHYHEYPRVRVAVGCSITKNSQHLTARSSVAIGQSPTSKPAFSQSAFLASPVTFSYICRGAKTADSEMISKFGSMRHRHVSSASILCTEPSAFVNSPETKSPGVPVRNMPWFPFEWFSGYRSTFTAKTFNPSDK